MFTEVQPGHAQLSAGKPVEAAFAIPCGPNLRKEFPDSQIDPSFAAG